MIGEGVGGRLDKGICEGMDGKKVDECMKGCIEGRIERWANDWKNEWVEKGVEG